MTDMHVLIATTGVLSPEPVVDFTRHLLGTSGRVSLITVVEVPRRFLEALDTTDWNPYDEQDAADSHDAVALRYLEERGHKLVEAVHQALQAAQIPCRVIYLEGEDPAAAISQAAGDLAADVVVLGSTRPIFAQDAWESVSARVMVESGKPVLVIPAPAKDIEADEDTP
ncbi:MAG: universal stress protein [Actinomycetota bacterium]|nr:universal stress protein [Actinomycetota bacterium]